MNYKSKIEELSKGFAPETLPKRMNLTDEQYAGYLEVYQYAINAGAKFPEVVATQWALESAWGTKPSGANNLFGVKTRSGEKGTVRTTKEDLDGKGSVSMKQEFLDYDTPEDSINDRLNRKHWKAAEANSDTAEEYINYLTFINKYATDAQYDVKLKNMVSSRHGIPMEELPSFSKDPGQDRLAREELFLNQYKEKQARNGMLADNIKKQQDALSTIPNFVPAAAEAQNELQGAYEEAYAMSDRPAMSFKPRESSSHIGRNTSTLRDRVYNPFNSEEEVAQMSAEKKNLVKQREEEFNFKGTPILNPKNMLAERSFKYGGALTEFNSGGTHTENPLGGIPQGQTPQGPNLVEEGETKYNDYIFSNSLYLSEQDVKDARLDKKLIGLSIAEASKVLNKFLDEAPFDKITRDTVNEQLDSLTLINENYNALHEEEENQQLMQDPVIAEQTMQEELAMEEMAMQEQAGMPSPEEMMMQDQQFMYGGELNFANGVEESSWFNKENVGKGVAGVAGAANILSNFSGANSTGDMGADALGGAVGGASAGMAFGPVGAAVGGGLGAISSIFGSAKAKRRAQQEREDKASRDFNAGFINEELTFSKGGPLKKDNRLDYLRQNFENNILPNIGNEEDYFKHELSPMGYDIIDPMHETIEQRNRGHVPMFSNDLIRSDANIRTNPRRFDNTKYYSSNFYDNILPNLSKDTNTEPNYTMSDTTLDEIVIDARKNKDNASLEYLRDNFEKNILPNLTKSDETVIDTPAGRSNQTTVAGNQDSRLSTMLPRSSGEQQITSNANIPNYAPSPTQVGSATRTDDVFGFTPRNNTLGNILRGAPIANSLIDVLNKEKPEHVSYQLSDYKYQPNFVDEQAITNNIRQGSANTLRSLEQSGLSSGQLAAAKLGMGANSVNSLNDAYLQINDRNNAERTRAQDIDYQVQASNLHTTNRQIEDNMQADAMARDMNRVNRNTLVNNISELGTELSNTNTAFNVSRGYTQSGQYNPYAALFRSKKDINPIKKRGGRLNNSIFVDDDADSINLMDNLIKSFKKNGK